MLSLMYLDILIVSVANTVIAAHAFWPHEGWLDENRKKNWPDPPKVITPHGPQATDWWRWEDAERTGPITSSTTSGSATVTPPPTTTAASNLGTSTPFTTTTNSSLPATKSCTEDNACCSIKSLQASFTSATANATATVPAALAYECINSVPYNQSVAVAFLDSIRPYTEWHTTLQYIKEPPAEYAEKVQPPYDFLAEFERIYSKARNETSNGTYSNEYEFGFDLFRAYCKTHDGHFYVFPDSVNGIFTWGRQTPLVSVSVDGSCIPEIYVYQDLLDTIIGNATYTPSPLALINGRDSVDFLLEWADLGSLQDPDALWNNLFYLLAQVSLDSDGSGVGTFAGGGRQRRVYPGPNTTLTFANGSESCTENFARVLMPFDNITSGADIYSQFFTLPEGEPESAEEVATYSEPSTSSSSMSSTSTSTSSTTVATTRPAPGYPTPLVRHIRNLNGGYFLEDDGYEDIAILSVPSFFPEDGDDTRAFQEINTYVINEAVKRKKTKLIIDVSANGGGLILTGIDLFKQLFPSIEPYQATRYRAHEAFDYIGQEISHLAGLIPNRSLDLNDTVKYFVGSSLNYRTEVNINHENFSSWADKFGPVALGPQQQNYSSVIRWNFSDPFIVQASGGIVVSGYQNRTNITSQPFKAEDIIIVTDGYCASTCTIFTELMAQQAGVRTIILGGRPNTNIAQAVGGVKGRLSSSGPYLFYLAQQPFTYQYIHNNSFYNTTTLGNYSDLALYRSTNVGVNSKDGYRQGDEEGAPLHFQYEAADCRIFFTPEMAVDMVAMWKTVADTAFRGINHCIAGSLESRAKGYIGQRSVQKGVKHKVRRDLGKGEHERAMREVWTDRHGVRMTGDAYMLP